MQLVTVFQTFSPAEAQLVRSQLDSAGFFVHVAHELSSLSMEGYAMAAGGILVQVPDKDADEARALLISGEPFSS
jgi:hypothetical protein